MNNIGNVVGALRRQTPPEKKYILWAKVIDPLVPDLVVICYWDALANDWLPLSEPKYYWNPVKDLLSIPPSSPVVGDRYIVTAGATGLWDAQDNDIAEFIIDHWEFRTPYEGVSALDLTSKSYYLFSSGVWESVVGGGGGGSAVGLFAPVANIVALEALDTSASDEWPSRYLIAVESAGIFRLDRASVATPNGTTIIAASVGNWIKETVRPSDLDVINNSIDDISGDISLINTQISDINDDITAINGDISDINDEIDAIVTDLADKVEQSDIDDSIAAYDIIIKDGVPTDGNTFLKLYNSIVGGFKEHSVANIAARNAYNVASLPQNVFVTNDGDGNWALYKATTTGVGATYIKISDPDLLNALMTASAIKTAYESNSDTNAFTNALLTKLNGIAAGATANQTDAYLLSRPNHTGDMPAANVAESGSRVFVTPTQKTSIHDQNTDTGTNSNSFSVGDGTNTGNKEIIANKLGATKPKMRWNTTTGFWEFSDDGTLYVALNLISSAADKTLSNLTSILTARQNLGLDFETANIAISSNVVTWNFVQSGVQKVFDTIDVGSVGADLLLTLTSAGIMGIAKFTKSTVNAVVVSLGGTDPSATTLVHKDSEQTIPGFILPAGLIGDEYFLTFYRFGVNVYWITRDGQIVQTLSYSTTDFPSVGLLKSSLDLKISQGGNTLGAAISLGPLDNNDFYLFRNGTANERVALLSTGVRLTGVVTGRTTGLTQTFSLDTLSIFGSGTAHSTLQSAGSFAAFVRSITGTRTLDSSDFIVLASGTFTVTLPTAVGVTGRQYIISNVSTGLITIATTSSQTINGVTSLTLPTQYSNIVVTSDGSNWQIIARTIVSRKRKTTATDYTILINEVGHNGIVAVTDTSVARNITFPLANSVPEGFSLGIKDESGAAGTNNISLLRASSDTLDGATSANINTNYQTKNYYSDGVSKWFTY